MLLKPALDPVRSSPIYFILHRIIVAIGKFPTFLVGWSATSAVWYAGA